jgi:hypothetical protein
VIGLLTCGLAACGKKGPPRPPYIEVPETTTDLTVRQEAADTVLLWSYPQLTRAGAALSDLARVEVWRLIVPPGQEQVAAGRSGDDLRRQLMLSRGTLLGRLEGKGLEAATRGSKLTFHDPLPPDSSGSVPSTFWYAVRSRRRDNTPSALSNIVTWQPKPIPPAVVGLKGTPGATGIALTWQALEGTHYLVQRRLSESTTWETVTTPPVEQAEYVDRAARQGSVWRYRVVAVANEAWGLPSAEIEVDYRDIYPPVAVTGLICLPDPRAVRLRWDAASETGVRYIVFRRVSGIWEHLADGLESTEFIDQAPLAGDTEYAVKATDAAGNQSPETRCTVRLSR